MKNINNILHKVINVRTEYIMALVLLTLIVVVGSFSYALYTTSNEKKGALSIVTGNLNSLIESTAFNDSKQVSVAANTTTTFTIKLSNPNSIQAKFNLYYESSDATNTTIGYLGTGDAAPGSDGIVLPKYNDTGYSKSINVKVTNKSTTTAITITFGSDVTLYNQTLTIPSGKSVLTLLQTPAYEQIFDATNIGANGAINTTDTDETFITGTNPNNYVWYSGKLWRAVAKNTGDNSVKLVTQWNISAVPYHTSSSSFSGSYMEQWLNDTGSDGFLGTLYNYANYIKTDSSWNATIDATDLGSITKPTNTTMVTDAVGLLNIYEYQMSYTGATYGTGYLNNYLIWWTLTPYDASDVRSVYDYGNARSDSPTRADGVRPSINLKSSVIISGGSGTETDPYTLSGDTSAATNDLLNTRKSGEYVTFDGGSYRIVDVEDSTTQLVSSEPLKVGGSFTTKAFDSSSTTTVLYTPTSSTNIGYYLNNDWYNSISSTYQAMIVDGTWYLGTVGYANYSLSKCTTAGINCTKNQTNVTAKVGLLRLGEELSGQFNTYSNNTSYWLLTPYSASYVRIVNSSGSANYYSPTNAVGVRPSINLKSSVKITGGAGTKSNPYTIG